MRLRRSASLLLGVCVLAPACAHQRVRYRDGPDTAAWTSTSARFCGYSHYSANDELLERADDDVDINVAACGFERPIHFRFRTRLGDQPLHFDVRVNEPELDAGYD